MQDLLVHGAISIGFMRMLYGVSLNFEIVVAVFITFIRLPPPPFFASPNLSLLWYDRPIPR